MEKKGLNDLRQGENKEGDSEIEEMLSDGIPIDNLETNPNLLAKQFLDLHRQNQLLKPLIGNVTSTISLYRRRENGDTDPDKIMERKIVLDGKMTPQDICYDWQI